VGEFIAYAANRLYGAAARVGIRSAAQSNVLQGNVSREAAEMLYRRDPTAAFRALDEVWPSIQALQRGRANTAGTLSFMGGFYGGQNR